MKRSIQIIGAGAGLAIVLFAAGIWVGQPRRRPSPPTQAAPVAPGRPDLLVYDAVSATFTRLPPDGSARVVRCPALDRWLVRVGVRNGELWALSSEQSAVVRLKMEDLVTDRCDADTVRSYPLADHVTPYRGVIAHDVLWLDVFREGLVERWDLLADPPAVRRYTLPREHELGLSDLLPAEDGSLRVASSGWVCFARECPNGRYAESALFQLAEGTAATPVRLRATHGDVNGHGLYRHRATRRTFWIFAGDIAGGHGAVAAIDDEGDVSASVELPVNAAPSFGVDVDDERFALLRFGGEHVFLFAAAPLRHVATLRFDGDHFVAEPLDAPIPERAHADFQDAVVDEDFAGRLFLVDARGERLVAATWHGDALTVDAITPLGTDAFRSGPAWAVLADR